MNLLGLDDRDGGATIAGVPGPAILAGPGARRVLGLRPEDIGVCPEGASETGIPAVLVCAEYHGADSLITFRVGTGLVTARQPGLARHAPGAPLRLSWPRKAEHLFDAGSGRRLPPSSLPDRQAA